MTDTDDDNDDNLSKSATRLGDRAAKMGNRNRNKREPEPEPEPEPEDEPEEPEVEFKPTTIYLPEEARKELRRFEKRITLDFPEIENAEKREMQTIMVRFALDHPEEIAELVEEELND